MKLVLWTLVLIVLAAGVVAWHGARTTNHLQETVVGKVLSYTH